MQFGTLRDVALAGLAMLAVAGSVGCGERPPFGALRVEPKVVNLPHAHAAPLRLEWRPSRPLEPLRGRPRAFVHLLGRDRELLRTFDHDLPEAWTPDRAQSYEIDLYQSAIAEALPPGAYELTFGLYDGSGGERWPLAVEGRTVGEREYRLGSLVVPAPAAGAPSYAFSGAWLPVEAGPSRQVIARRCSTGDATIVASEFPGVGAIRLALTTERGRPPVEVSASCTPERAVVDGPEFHWVGIAIAGDAMPCEIRFRPAASTGRPALCLEVLAWKPGGG